MFNIEEIKVLAGADAVNEGLPMEFKHPITGVPTGAIWKIRSYESEAYKAVERQKRTKGMKALRKGDVSAEKIDADTIDLIAALVVDWSGMKDGDKPLAFSRDAVVSLLSIPIAGSAIIKQIDDFAQDGDVFFKASSKPSQTPSATKSDT